MSRCYRPVVEVWNETPASVPEGMDAEEVASIIGLIADNCGTTYNEYVYDDNTVVYIEDGEKFLDYLDANEAADIACLVAGTDDDEWPEILAAVRGLKANTSAWRGSIDVKGDGCLRFYIDN